MTLAIVSSGSAALLAAAAYLMLTARYSVEAIHLAREAVPGGYVVGASLSVAVHLFGAGGLVLVALAFGEEVDWRRLRSGGTVLAATAIADFVGWVFRLIATLANSHDHDYRAFYIWTTVAMLLGAVAVGVVASASPHRGRGGRGRCGCGSGQSPPPPVIWWPPSACSTCRSLTLRRVTCTN